MKKCILHLNLHSDFPTKKYSRKMWWWWSLLKTKSQMFKNIIFLKISFNYWSLFKIAFNHRKFSNRLLQPCNTVNLSPRHHTIIPITACLLIPSLRNSVLYTVTSNETRSWLIFVFRNSLEHYVGHDDNDTLNTRTALKWNFAISLSLHPFLYPLRSITIPEWPPR